MIDNYFCRRYSKLKISLKDSPNFQQIIVDDEVERSRRLLKETKKCALGPPNIYALVDEMRQILGMTWHYVLAEM